MTTPIRFAQSPCLGRCVQVTGLDAESHLVCALQGYQRAGLITAEELTQIKKVDKHPRAKIESLLLSEGPTYAQLYLRLLKKLQGVDAQRCILVLIADALAGEFSR